MRASFNSSLVRGYRALGYKNLVANSHNIDGVFNGTPLVGLYFKDRLPKENRRLSDPFVG